MSAVLSENKRTEVTTTEQQASQARAVVEVLHADNIPPTRDASVALGREDGNVVPVPPELFSILQQVVEVISSGGTVTVGTLPKELTTTVAASILGISRPTLMKLISKGEISAHKVGTHSRVFASDVLEYKARRSVSRRSAFDALRAMEEDF
ncbi:helix-turn-helix domain-containing protein [Arthrobacter sp. B1805]|uniref:helix-turn-helix domain-containing protein n=1 Tax=Arthrobacter sp. B1805 TaxID=2058892 RepID=UPI000CE34E13|nr:helix-turn-helix domain-containing protein [Arthrobacter sp. B1805]